MSYNISLNLTINSIVNAVPGPWGAPAITADGLPFANFTSQLSNGSATVNGQTTGISAPQDYVLGVFADNGQGQWWGGPTWQTSPASDGSWSLDLDKGSTTFAAALMSSSFASTFYGASNYPDRTNAAISALPTAVTNPGDVVLSSEMPLGFNSYLQPWAGFGHNPGSLIPPGQSASNLASFAQLTNQPHEQEPVYTNNGDPTVSSNASTIWSGFTALLEEYGSPPGASVLVRGCDSQGNLTGGAFAIFLYANSKDLYLVAAGGPLPFVTATNAPIGVHAVNLFDSNSPIIGSGEVSVSVDVAVLPNALTLSVQSLSGSVNQLGCANTYALNSLASSVSKSLFDILLEALGVFEFV